MNPTLESLADALTPLRRLGISAPISVSWGWTVHLRQHGWVVLLRWGDHIALFGDPGDVEHAVHVEGGVAYTAASPQVVEDLLDEYARREAGASDD